jgi:hypothetical protein
MEPRPRKRALKVGFVPLLIFFLLTACSLVSWLNPEKRAQKRMKERALAGQEVVIVDGEEYVKVPGEGGKGARCRYVPVDEYVAERSAFFRSQEREEEGSKLPPQSDGKSASQPQALPTAGSREKAEVPDSSSINLRRKIVIAPFEEGEQVGDWGDLAARRLRESLELRTDTILCLDDRVVVDYLNERGIGSARFDDPMVSRIANTVFGVHAVLHGAISGPYVSASMGKGIDGESTALAVVRIQIKLVETATGRLVKVFEKSNPIFATEQRGKFSRDKAKFKAIQLAIEEVTGDIVEEINRMRWYTRIVKIDGDRVYLNAGRLTGLRVGDLMEVFGPGGGGVVGMAGMAMDLLEGQRKGQVRVSQLFGTDAAIAQRTHGGNFALSDMARPSTFQVVNTTR